jgi:hypothetical protein
MAKQLFGIFSPQLGEKKDYPVILLEKTVQVDNRNIIRKYGEVHRRQMREIDFLSWSSPTGHEEVGNWCDLNKAYDDDINTFAYNWTSSLSWSDWLVLTFGETLINKVQVYAKYSEASLIKVEYYTGSNWIQIYNGSFSFNEYNTFDIGATVTASKIRIALFNANTGYPKWLVCNEVRFYDYSDAQTPDGNPILHYHTFTKRSTATQYVLAFTKAHIYAWNPGTEEWDLKFTCKSDVTEWDTVSYNDKVIATNNSDMVLEWDTTGYFMPLQNTTATDITAATAADPCQITAVAHGLTTGDRVFIKDIVGMTELNNRQFVVTVIGVDTFTLDDEDSTLYTAYDSGGTVERFEGIKYDDTHYLTRAKYVTTFENFLILGYTYENGILHPQRERWNAIGDETAWNTGDAGSAETEGGDFITGFRIYSGQLVIFKERSRILQRIVATRDVWVWDKMPGNIGCLSNNSIVEDPLGRIYWFASDMTFREMQAGEISHDIDPIVKLIEPSSAHLVYGAYIDETGEIWWSIPYDNTLNNKVITYKDGSWGELELSVPAIGEYKEA